MDNYTIESMAKTMNISKQTLRYYDTLGLVCPQRLENGYRRYSKADYLDLQLVLMLKRGNFSLDEIKIVLKNRRDLGNPHASLAASKKFLHEKRENLIQQIHDLNNLVKMLDSTLKQVDALDSCEGIDQIIGEAYESVLE
ncbi:MerR family transcriptional regulator [Erysipelothrix sp. HDW6C]|uniref:MerR family transcriptional regulator n=1 Tax=Erysipelothrix sp. HDW6C TaxID=2714930 RepID=UPI00140D265B|nr:MerR family transcriptional regulator [Erysipelothrix sp. HDW6C]QIK68943.1 MerR family transcriptional regulator [Erysipelothrix sp. HDW6C]